MSRPGPQSRSIALAIALFAGAIVSSTLLLWWRRQGWSTDAFADALPIAPSLLLLLLPCIGSLVAIEFRRYAIASILSGAVAVFVAAVVFNWVLYKPPLFGYPAFAISGAEHILFPHANATTAATVLMLLALATVLLSIPRARQIGAPLAWATGLCIAIGFPLLSIVGALTQADATPTPFSDPLAAMIAIATVASGVALIYSQPVRAMPIELGARVRATVMVLALGSTLVLWHAVRAAEIKQLDAEVSFALDTTSSTLRKGLDTNAASSERLINHWGALEWPIAARIFMTDTRVFLRDFPAIATIVVTDLNGDIFHAARRAPPFGSEQRRDDEIVLSDSVERDLGLADGAYFRKLARATMQEGRRMRGDAIPLPGGGKLESSAISAVDSQDRPVGAMIFVYRRDIAVQELLIDAAAEFAIGLDVNGAPAYARAALGGNAALANQFEKRQKLDYAFTNYGLSVAPGERIVRRNLTWTPLFVLLFAWLSLSLVSFALYNERRAQGLFRERERILNQSLDIICTLDGNGEVVTINEAMQRLLGYAPETTIGRQLAAYVHADDRELLRGELTIGNSDTQRRTPPLRVLSRSGQVLYMQGDVQWSRAEQLFYCALRDVTTQRKLELERQYAEDTFRAGVEQAGCVVYELLPESSEIRWVGAVKSLTGFEPEELAAGGFDAWMQAVHPDDRAHVRQILQRCIETRQPHTTDYRLRRKDGSIAPVLDRGRHIVDPSSKTPRMIGALLDLTAIRHQEAALRRSEERYRIIATQVGAVIIERDCATGRIHAYGPVEAMFGYSKEQVESRPIGIEDVMVHPDDRARVTVAKDEAERKLSTYYVEYRRRHRGGHYIHIATRGVYLPGPDGRAERSVIAITDITERKLAEQRLQDSEERFRLAAEQAGQIVYEWNFDEQGKVAELRFGGAFEPMLGYQARDFRERLLRERFALVHPDDLPMVRAIDALQPGGSDQFQVEHRMQHAQGHYIHVENRGAVRRGAHGGIASIVGMLLDISSRRAAEADRQRYTTQLRMLADIARSVSTILSPHELLHTLAKSMRELLGANAAMASLAKQSESEDFVAAISYADQHGDNRDYRIRPLNSDALHALVYESRAPVCLSRAQIAAHPQWAALAEQDETHQPLHGWLGAPLTARDGGSLGVLELSDKADGDFTDSDVQVLSQLAGLASVAIENIQLYATLEQRVAARTRELEISNRELEAFSYSVSHDLRAPLRAIAGFSSILEEEYGRSLQGEARRYLARITNGVEHMANLIDDLLSLARVSRADLKRESVDITALCRAIVKRHKERWPERDLDIAIDTRMRATADPRLVEVALENLIENALKFTATRRKTHIHIGRRAIDGRPTFFVRDNGVGFDPKYASNLFGVFQRLHSVNEFPGTGVGLATVQRIVQRHRGRTWAESTLDQGATFYFTLDGEA